MKNKRVNLAEEILNNPSCMGFIWKYNNGKYGYQNDNDLGLDLEPLDFEQSYIRKVFLDDKHFVYQLRYGASDDGCGATLKTVCALLKECHPHSFPELNRYEKQMCNRYWGTPLIK